MNSETKNTLIEQIKLLAERSKNTDTENLLKLTAQIISLGQVLQSQVYGAMRWHPQYGWLTVKDLENLKFAREERSRRLDEHLKRLGVQITRRSECV